MQGRTAAFPPSADAQFDETAFEAQLDGKSDGHDGFLLLDPQTKDAASCQDYVEALLQLTRPRRCFGSRPHISICLTTSITPR